MATNQYGVTLKETLETRYNMPFKDAMQMLADRGLTRAEIAKKLSVSQSTIIKHTLNLGINFERYDNYIVKNNKELLMKNELKMKLKEEQVTPINVLSKKWCDFNG